MSALGLEKVSGTVKALWTFGTIFVSVVTAIASTAIYVHDLIQRVDALEGQVNSMSQQLKQVSSATRFNFDFNGSADPICADGSFLRGLRFGVDSNGNPHGNIWCSKVQPEIQ